MRRRGQDRERHPRGGDTRHPGGTDRYTREGREHFGGYENNARAHGAYDQGYRTMEEGPFPDDDMRYDERSWSTYSQGREGAPQEQPPRGRRREPERYQARGYQAQGFQAQDDRSGRGAPWGRSYGEYGGAEGMNRGSWQGRGWGGEEYRGGLDSSNYESPYMPRRTGGGTYAWNDRDERSYGGELHVHEEATTGDPSDLPPHSGGYGGQPRRMSGAYGITSEREHLPPPPPRARQAVLRPSIHQGRGEHFGKGPKGYRRSDERIREDVCERLLEHDEIDASEIEVTIQNAEVTLSGTVSQREFKHMAERVAETVSGVHDIHNLIRVRRDHEREQQAGPQRTLVAGNNGRRPGDGDVRS